MVLLQMRKLGHPASTNDRDRFLDVMQGLEMKQPA